MIYLFKIKLKLNKMFHCLILCINYETLINKNKLPPMHAKKNSFYQSLKNSKEKLVNQMQSKQFAFKTFVSSLQKSSNRYLSSDINPEETLLKRVQTIWKNSTKKTLTKQPVFKLESYKFNNSRMNQKSQDPSSGNFRISKLKPSQKSQPYSLKQQKNVEFIQNMQLRLTKTTYKPNQSLQKKSFLSKNNESAQIYKRNSSIIVQKFFNPSDQQKTNIKQIYQSQQKLKLQQIHSISWNPESNSFLTKLYSQQKRFQQKSSFMPQMLNINIQNTIKFLKEQKALVEQLENCEGKKVCSFFREILNISSIKNIDEPLIKKYKNCIFYGQKPGFESNHSGIILYLNGNVYFGSLRNFQKNGLGIQFIKSSNLSEKSMKLQFYEGEADEYIVYRGNFYKNSKTGQFLINAPDYVYQGTLVKGLFQGSGTLITPVSIFKGKWSMNKKVHGAEQFKNKDMVYEGEYQNGNFHGQGKLKCSEQLYQGQFSNNKKHGEGIIVNKEYIYEGSFENDKKHGIGTYIQKREIDQQIGEDMNSQNESIKFIYSVQFREDKLINKTQLKQMQLNQEKPQTLQSLQEDHSDHQSMTILSEYNKPSNILSCTKKENTPQKQFNHNFFLENNYKKYRQFLAVIPTEPEEEVLFRNTIGTYLKGNKFHRLPKRIKD